MAQHPVLVKGSVAVVTGGASGIGLAACKRFAALGLKVVIADLAGARLEDAAAAVAGEAADGSVSVLAQPTDVSRREDVEALERAAIAQFGGIDVLMNNAGIQPGGALFGSPETWHRILDVNLWGIVNGTQVIVPGMAARGRPGLVINTGSKQGITTPPGDPAYNVSKAAVKAFTEALAHELRTMPGSGVTAHLLIPGFVYTALTANGRTEKPAAAWTAEETVDFMLESLGRGDFYILCPDNDVSRALDEKRIAWAAGDIIENRPALSRWHPDHADAFKASVAGL